MDVYRDADKIFMLFGISDNYVLCTERGSQEGQQNGGLKRVGAVHCEVIRRGKNVTKGWLLFDRRDPEKYTRPYYVSAFRRLSFLQKNLLSILIIL